MQYIFTVYTYMYTKRITSKNKQQRKYTTKTLEMAFSKR